MHLVWDIAHLNNGIYAKLGSEFGICKDTNILATCLIISLAKEDKCTLIVEN